MNLGKSLSQEGGDQSSNFQANTINYNSIIGITYSDAKEIALDVFEVNFLRLSQGAAEVAHKRAEELVELFLNKLKTENPNLLSSVQDPDMQFALYEAQKAYARSGEDELKEILASLLVSRSRELSRSLMQIVLSESISIAQKLTLQHLDTLSLIFLIKESVRSGIDSREALKKYIDTWFIPFIDLITMSPACYKHLQFTGCCSSVGIPQNILAHYFLKPFKALFSKGFENGDYIKNIVGEINIESILIPCLNNSDLFQFRALNNEDLAAKLQRVFDQNIIKQLNRIFDDTTMNIDEANQYLVDINPKMSKLINIWQESNMCILSLNSVGIVLACMNIERKLGIKIDLSHWFPDDSLEGQILEDFPKMSIIYTRSEK